MKAFANYLRDSSPCPSSNSTKWKSVGERREIPAISIRGAGASRIPVAVFYLASASRDIRMTGVIHSEPDTVAFRKEDGVSGSK